MKILIIGTGYVGLVSGTCFAEMGHHVTCIDIDSDKIAKLRKGIIPIYEPGLEEMIKRNAKAGRLFFTEDDSEHIPLNEICFIAVNTPPGADGSADISQAEEVARRIGLHLNRHCTIVTKSTVPPGTSMKIAEIIENELRKRKLSVSFDIVSNPEFLKEGNAISDFMKPDRVIVGVNNERSASVMKELYAPFMHNHERLIIMDILSAELSKYAANAMLATRISFMNEMALLCEKIGADVNWIRKAIGADERIGNKFLYPGVGYGGSCFPKDINALLHEGNRTGFELKILKAVDEVNRRQKKIMTSKISNYFSLRNGLSGKTIGILGLSFKPDTDDMREAPSLILIRDLLEQNVRLRLFDPVAMENAKALIGVDRTQITWCSDESETAQDADALVLMTEWKQFRLLDFTTLLTAMNGRAFFDGRNQYNPDEMRRKGFDYFSVGRLKPETDPR